MAESEHEAVAAQIVADPDATDGYLVLADLLLGAGDPRGELIVLQHRLTTGQVDRKLRVRAQKLLERQETALERLLGAKIEATWRLGYLQTVTITPAAQVGTLVRTLFAHPSARFVTEVRIRESLILGRGTRSHSATALGALAKANPLTVRKLHVQRTVVISPSLRSWEIVEAGRPETCEHARLELAMPNLRELEATGDSVLHELDSPTLRTLTLDRTPICDIGRWDLPRLASLDWKTVAMAPDYAAQNRQADAVRSLFTRDLPALRDLTLRGELPAGLASSPAAIDFIARLARLCIHSSAFDWNNFVPAAYEHLQVLIVQCRTNFTPPHHAVVRLPRAIWLRNESLDRSEVGLDVKPPRRR
ncbi:MAG: hypothetical protein ABI867_20825 [Kofleriaceae bacterium]